MYDKDIEAQRAALAAEFDRDLDPLAEYADGLARQGIDPFEMYWAEVVEAKDHEEGTREKYRGIHEQWKEFMWETVGRHPACPSEEHVKRFINREVNEKGNTQRSTRRKIFTLSRAYRYFQEDGAFPHPIDVNPFHSAYMKSGLSDEDVKKPPWLELPELREYVHSIDHIRDQAFVVTGLKLGMRAGEIGNIRIEDVTLPNPDVRDHYDDLGTQEPLRGRKSAIFVPDDRKGNKSKRPRVLPLDDEMKQVLTRYLLMRPDVDEPWLFLSKNELTKTTNQAVNEAWTDTFQPDYAETERYRGVTSHYGRHYFSTFFEKRVGMDERDVQYMRGDKIGGDDYDSKTIDSYVHTYYEDIRQQYIDNVFKLRV